MADKTGKHQEIAERNFKNLLAFMGDRKYATPELLGQEILKSGVEIKEMRDEIYAQIMKQLISNPSESSLARGWEFMLLALDSFPPIASENYLENFIRKTAKDPKLFVRTLHQTMYGGARQIAPTTDEMSAITGGRAQNRLGYSVSVYERPADFKDIKDASLNASATGSGGAAPSKPPPPGRPQAPKPRGAPSAPSRPAAPKPRPAPVPEDPPADEEPAAPAAPAPAIKPRAPAPRPPGAAAPPMGAPRAPAPRPPGAARAPAPRR